ncbi:MAG TPA: ATP-grasp domain-containing protein [Thermomicrobiales bacterium]|nr:ATP-grasp domain-containing protein [Thermomicrobiales bacterium]
MARLLEDDAKRLLSEHGLTVPSGQRASTAEAAAAVADAFGGSCVVKALIPIGRRGKAGLVELCRDSRGARESAGRMLGAAFDARRVEMVLVEELVGIVSEHYLSISLDAESLEFAVLISGRGGVDIEEHARSVVRLGVSPSRELDTDAAVTAWTAAGCGLHAATLADATKCALAAFQELDATLLEINPLAIDSSERVVVVGAMLAVDDAALARQPRVAPLVVAGSDRATRPETELERRVADINADMTQRGSARYLELDGGDIGFLCGGGGASLLLFDALVRAGGTPANYSEFGGNPTEQRVYDLARVVLDKPGVAGLFVAHNITNNTQVDIVARGVTRAISDAGLPVSFPVVAREVGVNDDEGRSVFEAAGVSYLGADVSLDQAARLMVERMKAVGSR